MKNLKYFVVGLIVLLILPVTLLTNPRRAEAALNYGNLISDAEFTNRTTLDATGVQLFLNTRGGTRLRTFSEDGRSAAQIIADASRSNDINPFVILATIQKEESLVDSNTNFDYRINWAMGFGICDSCSPDDANVQKYRGFTKQIDNAAWQLKHNYSYWAANGSDWTVGRTMIIDDLAVRFANRATSALYRYTPHLHGNENFYRLYNQYKAFHYVSKYSKEGKIAEKLSKVGAGKTAVSKTTVNKTGQTGQPAQTYNAQFVQSTMPQTLRAGRQLTVYIYLKNTGTTAWKSTGANPVYVGNSDPRDRSSVLTGGNVRWRMSKTSVAPGKVGVFSARITAPGAGSYSEKFQAVAEGATWFGSEFALNFNVR